MNADAEAIKAMLAAAPRRVVQIDDTQCIYIGEDTKGKVERDIKLALGRGATVTENGVAQWMEWWPIIQPGKSGSDVYIWKGGDDIKCERFLFTKDANGEVTKKLVGKAFRPAKDLI